MSIGYVSSRSTKVMLTALGVLLLSYPLARGHAQESEASAGRPLAGKAGDFALKIEPGLAIPLSKPQSKRFDLGGGQTVKALWALSEQVDLGPSVTFLSLPSEVEARDSGTAWMFGGSLRFKRSHSVPGEGMRAISPWADADLTYVRTGQLNRAGLAIGAGLALPVGRARAFWAGPFVRYQQIFQGDRSGFDSNDAKILSVGLSLEVGPGIRRESAFTPAPASTGAPLAEARNEGCPDRDQDGIPDNIDHCPDVAGPMESWGCRAYEKVVVTKEKVELKERLYFAFDKAVIKEASFPALDELALVLKENSSIHVRVEGHTSSPGTTAYNQTLSEQRAQAVVDYLIAHGVAKERLLAKGLGETDPSDTNVTVEGRGNNRVVSFEIVDDGSK